MHCPHDFESTSSAMEILQEKLKKLCMSSQNTHEEYVVLNKREQICAPSGDLIRTIEANIFRHTFYMEKGATLYGRC